MLGLLLLAGLGVAAAALVEHVDSQSDDEEPVEDTPPDDLADEKDLLASFDQDPPSEDSPSEEVPSEEVPTEDASPEGTSNESVPQTDDTAPVTDTSQEHPPAEDAPQVEETAFPEGQSTSAAAHKVYGGAGDDRLSGTSGRDFLDGGGGDDTLLGKAGADHLVTFDAGADRAFGGRGADSLHGYVAEAPPGGDASFIVEDHEADRLMGGAGADKLWLASDDQGSGGAGSDEFHLSWDVEPGHPATITDYQPGTDRLVVEYTSHRADAEMTAITAEDQQITTEPLEDGSGTAICLGGTPIAHVLGTTGLRAADIAVVHI